ncbi:hypothetical protein SELMODRAFT_76748 [Selaginella moellendorffii]|uniref:Beta-glucosidase n=1 Tax=Selaginella moellendorffii TaxID=88036 RepID=D8QT04_SELML|nr:hypothetical protein SELMODRAFT_76748 [Selaginella moellendorffii]
MRSIGSILARLLVCGFLIFGDGSLSDGARVAPLLRVSDGILLQDGISSQERLGRCDFPQGFVFGVSSSAYQYEGAAAEGGRQPSIWDTFSHTQGKIQDGTTGDLANDQYHRFREDVGLIKNMGMDAYRFSISWSRFFIDGSVNVEGQAYYNALIDELLSAGIEPYVTLNHFDLPQALDGSNGGWLNSSIVDIFAAYAEACFDAFGDRVKTWITFNEPQLFSLKAYSEGSHAPGRCSSCSNGNSLTEPYIVGHNMLLSHAAAVRIYKHKFQARQGGKIGITLNSYWFEPFSNSKMDIEASKRSLDFELGWYVSPLTSGNYPERMRTRLGPRLPVFTEEQRQAVKSSIDFLGLNHYTTRYVQDMPAVTPANTANGDSQVLQLVARNGVEIGPKSASSWLYIVPWGIEKLLLYVKDHYNPPEIIITENGMDEANDPSAPLEQSLQDHNRIKFYQSYLKYLLQAVKKGVNVRGYLAWTLLDDFEWRFGYMQRFGLHFVDFKDNMRRYPKLSSLWFKQMLKDRNCESKSAL